MHNRKFVKASLIIIVCPFYNNIRHNKQTIVIKLRVSLVIWVFEFPVKFRKLYVIIGKYYFIKLKNA